MKSSVTKAETKYDAILVRGEHSLDYGADVAANQAAQVASESRSVNVSELGYNRVNDNCHEEKRQGYEPTEAACGGAAIRLVFRSKEALLFVGRTDSHSAKDEKDRDQDLPGRHSDCRSSTN